MGRALLEGEAVLREVLEWEVGLQALHQRIAGRFSRSESRQRVLSYLKGLLGSVERKNGWQLAEHAGDATPDGVQRLLAVYHWDADQVRDDLQGYVVEHLGDAGGVLVVDETGFLKQGRKSVGVKRQYSGTAGKVENCQIGVFLAYGSCYGAAFLDRELYLPQEWAEDVERRQEAGVPEEVVFHTKAQLAQTMIARAVSAGVPFGWVAGDTVYGNDRRLRRWLEEQGLPYVLAVKSNEPLWADTERGSTQVAARELAQQIPDDQWQRLSAGDGSKGPRLYDWGRLQVRPWSEPDQGHWLLVRRSIADPEDLAYYACFGAAEVPLAELVRVAGSRWIIEDAFKEAKQEVGLGEYQVRRWVGWYRHITLVRPRRTGPCFPHGNPALRRRWRWQKGAMLPGELIPVTVPEVRRLLCRLLWLPRGSPALTIQWSGWRRRHQARARQCHYKRRFLRLSPQARL